MTKKRQNLKQLFLFNGLLLLVTFIVLQYSVVQSEDSQPVPTEKTAITALDHIDFNDYYQKFDAPRDFPNITFKTVLGKSMAMDDLKGQWVVLNFWATWCPPCLLEMPSLQALQDQYGGQGVKVVAISLDRGMNADMLRQVMVKHGFGAVSAYYGDWPTIRDNVSIPGLPTSYILDPSGKAVGTITAPMDWTSDAVEKFMDDLLL